MDDTGSIDRFLALVRRELGTEDVRLFESREAPESAANTLIARFADGRGVIATFAEVPADLDARQRRLDMIAGTFAQTAHAPPREGSRPPPARSLSDELRALVVRARGIDALVIDANSPIIWGAAASGAEDREPANDSVVLLDRSRSQLVDDDARSDSDGNVPIAEPSQPRARAFEGALSASMERESGTAMSDADESGANVVDTNPMTLIHDRGQAAIEAVRALPVIDELRKGRLLHHLERGQRLAYLAHSFASIYVLIVVFDGPFDEIRAERAVGDGLPQIERLVLALPPFDPDPAPMAGVISMRRPRRR